MNYTNTGFGGQARAQPQGIAPLSKASRIGQAAQAITLGSFDTNVVTGAPLTGIGGTASTPAKGSVARINTAVGKALAFRKSATRGTAVLPTIGTQSFVEFWYGYPSADQGNNGNGTDDPTFLTGSSNNMTAICARLGSNHNGGGYPESWGALYSWGDVFNAAQDTLTPGVLTMLIVVRRQDRMELWRDGVLRRTVMQTPISISSSAFVLSAFLESDYWTSSSDMVLAGRAIIEPTADEVQALSSNPFSLFDQTYNATYSEPFSYLNSGVGSQAYSPAYSGTTASASFSYSNAGAGSQTYSPKYSAKPTYANSGAGAQAYAAKFRATPSYTSSSTGSQAYSSGFGAPKSYANSGIGSQSYTLSLAGAGLSYSNSGAGTQAYVPQFRAPVSYLNSGVGAQSYAESNSELFSYSNSGIGSQNYVPTISKTSVLPQNYGGGITHVPRPEPKPTRQEKKDLKKAKLHLVDQEKVDALKQSIQVEVPLDRYWVEQIELARLMMEQELAARLEEEEMQMVVVMALAHHRRNRFHRLAA